MQEKSSFEPSPKFFGANFYRQLSNIAEMLAFFSCGVLVCFLARLLPQLFILLVLVYLMAIAYLAITREENPLATVLRLTALLLAVFGGFWDFWWLWVSLVPDVANSVALLVAAAVIAGACVATYLVVRVRRWG